MKNFLLRSISKSNLEQKKYIYNEFKKLNISKKNKIIFLGLTYKKGTSTLRRSEALDFFKWLIRNNYKNIKIHDPIVKNFDNKYKDFFTKNLKNDLIKADCILLFYNQLFYKNYYKFIKKTNKKRFIFDPFCLFKIKNQIKQI